MTESGSAALKGMAIAVALGASMVGGPASAQLSVSVNPPSNPITVGGTPNPGFTLTSGNVNLGIGGGIVINTSGSAGGGSAITITTNPPATAPVPATVAATLQPVVGRAPSLVVNPALGIAPVNPRGITMRDGGLVGLVGPASAASGVITATVDKVTIGGAETLTVDLAGDGLLKLQVARPLVDAHGQALSAQSRTVALTAHAARDVVDGVTNAQGRAAAHSVANVGGVIVFGGAPPR